MDAAYEGLEQVAASTADTGDWIFKAKKQMIKVLFAQRRRDEVLEQYDGLLEYLGSEKLATSYAEKSFTNMIDLLTSSKKSTSWSTNKKGADTETVNFIEKIYVATLAKLVQIKNERMWIKTNLKLAKLYAEQDQVDKALTVLIQIQNVCLGASLASSSGSLDVGGVPLKLSGDENNLKSSYLMEVYAQMIVLYSGIGDYKKVKEIYRQTEPLKSAVPHPRILGVISEAGGKMQMREKRYELARQAFFDSFKNYDEAGSLQRIAVLKYYVLACMLSETKINPFESQETRPYRNDPQISVMVQLVEAFQRNDIEEFQRLLQNKGNKEDIMGDPFIEEFLGDIEFSARSLGVLKLVRPYTRVKFSKIAASLGIPESLVIEILTSLIFNTKLPFARLDSRGQFVELHAASLHIDLNSHFRKLARRLTQKSSGAAGAVDAASAKIGSDDAVLDELDDTNSTPLARAPFVGVVDGGLAPVLGVYQAPTRVLQLSTEGRSSFDEFVASISGPSLLNPTISMALSATATASGNNSLPEPSNTGRKTGPIAPVVKPVSTIKSQYLQGCTINVGASLAESKTLFSIPKRYVQAATESKNSSEASASATGEGAGGGSGSTEVKADAAGSSSGGAAGGAGSNSGAGGASVGGTTADGKSLASASKGVDVGFRAGSIDPANPYAWQVQEAHRTLALLGWAQSVDRLQQATERGGVAAGVHAGSAAPGYHIPWSGAPVSIRASLAGLAEDDEGASGSADGSSAAAVAQWNAVLGGNGSGRGGSLRNVQGQRPVTGARPVLLSGSMSGNCQRAAAQVWGHQSHLV